MTATEVSTAQVPTFLSEVFPLVISQPNLSCFQLTPEVDKQEGNRFAFRFSRKFPEIVVICNKGYFWILAKPGQSLPSQEQWQKALLSIQEELREDLGDCSYLIEWTSQP